METFWKKKMIKLTIRSIKHKVTLKFCSKSWVAKGINEQSMEESYMKVLIR